MSAANLTTNEPAGELEQALGRSRKCGAALAVALLALAKGEITAAEAKRLTREANSATRDVNRLIKAIKAKPPAGA